MYFIISWLNRREMMSCALGLTLAPEEEAMMAAIRPPRAAGLRDTTRYSAMPVSACKAPSSRAVPAPASAPRHLCESCTSACSLPSSWAVSAPAYDCQAC